MSDDLVDRDRYIRDALADARKEQAAFVTPDLNLIQVGNKVGSVGYDVQGDPYFVTDTGEVYTIDQGGALHPHVSPGEYLSRAVQKGDGRRLAQDDDGTLAWVDENGRVLDKTGWGINAQVVKNSIRLDAQAKKGGKRITIDDLHINLKVDLSGWPDHVDSDAPDITVLYPPWLKAIHNRMIESPINWDQELTRQVKVRYKIAQLAGMPPLCPYCLVYVDFSSEVYDPFYFATWLADGETQCDYCKMAHAVEALAGNAKYGALASAVRQSIEVDRWVGMMLPQGERSPVFGFPGGGGKAWHQERDRRAPLFHAAYFEVYKNDPYARNFTTIPHGAIAY